MAVEECDTEEEVDPKQEGHAGGGEHVVEQEHGSRQSQYICVARMKTFRKHF